MRPFKDQVIQAVAGAHQGERKLLYDKGVQISLDRYFCVCVCVYVFLYECRGFERERD